MLGLLGIALVQATVGAPSPVLDRPATRIERLLDDADSAIHTAGQFSCIGTRRDQEETAALRVRYDRVFAALERQLGRPPYGAITMADCTLLDRAEYWEARHRATARLNEVERMLRQGRTD
jgi:glutathione S-transferase